MAATFIYPIKVTGKNSINYDEENKTAKVIKEKNDSLDSLQYVMRDKKGNFHNLSKEYLDKIKDYVTIDESGTYIFKTVSSYLNCSKKDLYEQWQRVRELKNRENGERGNIQYCIVQNFGDEYIDPHMANEIGVKFAREYLSKYQCVVSTHVNTGLIHNHIEFNATSFIDGKKFDDRLSVVYEIREISDRLCREYGLSVLEDTTAENAKVVVYKDLQGKVCFYEPTERKESENNRKLANINDYRNYEQYQQGAIYEQSHVNILKESIDRNLLYATSYDELLDLMRDEGFEIKSKTKVGEWRKHISFKSETWDKFVRDSQIGDDYTRIALTNQIAENVKIGKVLPEPKENQNVSGDRDPDSDIYMYGRIIIDEIDDNYRRRKKNEKYEKVQRSEVEKYIISDTKRMNREINIAMKNAVYPKREFQKAESREEYLIQRINSNLRTLRFVEDKNIQSMAQLNDFVKSLYEQRNTCYAQMERIGQALKMLSANIALIERYNELQERIDKNSTNPDYVLYEKDDDVSVLKSMENTLQQRNLLEQKKQEEFKSNYNRFAKSFKQFEGALEKVNADIQKYDDCIFNINLVDKKNGGRYEKQIKIYYDTKQMYRPIQQKQDEKRKEDEGRN